MQTNRQTNEPQNKLPPGCVKTENRKINKKSKNKNQPEHLVIVLTAERGLCSYALCSLGHRLTPLLWAIHSLSTRKQLSPISSPLPSLRSRPPVSSSSGVWGGAKSVATRRHILKLKCTEFDFDWGPSWAICKSAPLSRQTTMPTPHHSFFYRPDALPAAQPTASKH